MTSATFAPGDRVRILTGASGGRTGIVVSAYPGMNGPVVNVEHERPLLLMDPDGPSQVARLPYAPEELEHTATYPPGTRVRRTDNGRTGTVDYTAVETDLLVEHPGMVPVAYDGDDAWLTAAHVLEVIDPLPEAVEPQEPEKTANDGGANERSTTMSSTTFNLDEVRAGYASRIREAIQETSGATIRSAARAMGMAPITLSRRLNGRSGKVFNITELRALADHLGIDWLSFFPDEMPARDVPKVVSLQDAR